MHRVLLTAGAVALLVLAACSNAEPTPDPKVAFCDSLRTLSSSVKDFRALGANDTVEDVQTSAAAVKTAAEAVKTAAGNLAESEVATIQTAAGELESAVGDIDPEDTVAEAVTSLAPQARAFHQSVSAAHETHCGAALLEAEATAAAEAAASLQAAAESIVPDVEASPAG